METVTVQDVRIPRIGLGTWEVTGSDAYRSVRTGLELGYRHLDTAQIYGNEEEVGRALSDADIERDHVFLTTKVWFRNARADDVLGSTAESLKRLGTDYVDLLLLHWPNTVAPLEETLAAMERLRAQGRTRLIGVSNFPSRLLRHAAEIAPLATNQVEYHPFLDQSPVLEVVRDLGIVLTAYSPLAHGKATTNAVLEEIGERHGRSAATVALRWLLDQPEVVVLPRSRNPDHIAENLEVDFELTEEDQHKIDALPKDRRVVDPPFAPAWD